MAKRKWWQWLLDPAGLFDGWSNILSGKKSFGDAFYGEGTPLGDLARTFGDVSNEISGDYASADYQDAIADENADVAFKRQKELLDLEAQYNSPVYKSNELGKAGLNPALASGMSNSVGGASAQMATPNSGQGNVLGLIKTMADMSLLSEQQRGLRLDNDLKSQELYEKTDSYPVRWLGMHADAQGALSANQKLLDEIEFLRYELEWNRKTEQQRIDLMESETAKNKAISAYNRQSAEEKRLTNEQLDNWIEKYMDDDQRAELDRKLAVAEGIEDANDRANAIFYAKCTALVAGGICMFVPGAQGIGIALLTTAVGLESAQQFDRALNPPKRIGYK